MESSGQRDWIGTAILVGLTYLVAGIVFGALAGAAASSQMRTAWRLAAWLTSAIAFAAHIRHDHLRLQNRPVVTASHAAAAVAFGAFALAVAANIHAMSVASGNRRLLAIALVAWPALAGIPAFLVALAATAVLARTRRSV